MFSTCDCHIHVHVCRSMCMRCMYMYIYKELYSLIFMMKPSDSRNPVSVTNVNLQLSVGKSHVPLLHYNCSICTAFNMGSNLPLNTNPLSPWSYFHLSLPLFLSPFHNILGKPQSFHVTITPLRNLPLDLYVLIDLSASMIEEFNALKAVSGDIGIASVCMFIHNMQG